MLAWGWSEPAERSFDSGDRQVALLELYTSQGCSSCPPAERWLAGQMSDQGLWKDFVPIALHVDYWDRLGWRDPYAQPDHARRQRQYAAQWNASSIATPSFVWQGKKWPGYFKGSPLPAATGKAGRLTLVLKPSGHGVATYRPLAGSTTKALVFRGGWLLTNLVTDVPRGENAGRRLKGAFVLSRLEQSFFRKQGEVWRAEVRWQGAPADVPALAVGGWVEASGVQRPLQAVGGWWRAPSFR